MSQPEKGFFPAAIWLYDLLGRMGYVDSKYPTGGGLPPPHPLNVHVARMCMIMYRISTRLHLYTTSVEDEKKDKYPWIFPLIVCDIVCEYLIRDSPQMGLSSLHITRCLNNSVRETDPHSPGVSFMYGSSVLHKLLLLSRTGKNKDPFFQGAKGNWIPSDTDVKIDNMICSQHDRALLIKTATSQDFLRSLFHHSFSKNLEKVIIKSTNGDHSPNRYIFKVNIFSGTRKIFSIDICLEVGFAGEDIVGGNYLLAVDMGGFICPDNKEMTKTLRRASLEINSLDFFYYNDEEVRKLMPERITSLLEAERRDSKKTLLPKIVNCFLDNQKRREKMYRKRAKKDNVGFKRHEVECTRNQLYLIVLDSVRYGQEE